MIKEKCQDCGGKLINHKNDIICKKCGLVIEDAQIDLGKENPMQETSPPTNIFHPIGSYYNPKEKNSKRKQ